MEYFEFIFTFEPQNDIINDVLTATLGEVGFESFITEDEKLKAYIQTDQFSKPKLDESLADFPLPTESITYTYSKVENKDWNEEWEKNYFKPIVIGNDCAIHSTFHKDIPPTKYNIIINPQMAFGTGHHETTGLIIKELLHIDLTCKTVLDMGCGTSILSILAHKRGAKKITAIDIDTWCVDNSKENCALNNIYDIDIKHGDASILKNETPFDLIIANINRNILLQDMELYSEVLNKGGNLIMSGFYTEDIPFLEEHGKTLNLKLIKTSSNNNWACITLQK